MYKCFIFVHSHLSTVQKGIQAAHAVAEMINRNVHKEELIQWVSEDKTIVLLEGGNSKSLEKKYNTFCSMVGWNGIYPPMAIFEEDDDTLSGVFTSFAVVLSDEDLLYTKDDRVIIINNSELVKV